MTSGLKISFQLNFSFFTYFWSGIVNSFCEFPDVLWFGVMDTLKCLNQLMFRTKYFLGPLCLDIKEGETFD